MATRSNPGDARASQLKAEDYEKAVTFLSVHLGADWLPDQGSIEGALDDYLASELTDRDGRELLSQLEGLIGLGFTDEELVTLIENNWQSQASILSFGSYDRVLHLARDFLVESQRR